MEKIPQPKDYQNRIEILRLAASQIEKDFAEAGILIDVTDNPENAFEGILKQVAHWTAKLLQENNSKFLNLLYRIDLSESKLRSEISKSNKDSNWVIAEQILLREMQKVLFRIQYSENPELRALINPK